MKIVAAVALLLLPSFALADVADSSASGFTVKISMTIQAKPADVYRKLVHNVADWWNSEHTFSGSAKNLSIEEKPMGCFCEAIPGRGGVRHMEVLRYETGKLLVMSGALGPMQPLAATGTMTIQLAPAENGTKFDLTYTLGGYSAAGLNTWAAPADGMLKEQFGRLKKYAEQ
jgi:uncharacterized protein YndB with AHSA1/START domain